MDHLNVNYVWRELQKCSNPVIHVMHFMSMPKWKLTVEIVFARLRERRTNAKTMKQKRWIGMKEITHACISIYTIFVNDSISLWSPHHIRVHTNTDTLSFNCDITAVVHVSYSLCVSRYCCCCWCYLFIFFLRQITGESN